MTCKFFKMLNSRWNSGARVCIGLDSDTKKIPEKYWRGSLNHGVPAFNDAIVEMTEDFALAYKPNIAFYAGRGDEGWHDLLSTIVSIRHTAPDVPIILDAKRADIGNTNAGYVDEAFAEACFAADAVTVNPYFGMEAMKPFLDQKDKGIIVLCKTSNPGSGEFQDLSVFAGSSETGLPTFILFHQVVARNVAKTWNSNGNCALVVGATYPDELGMVRKIVGDDMHILIPGFGAAQGGRVEDAVPAGVNSQKRNIIPNFSSGIIFAEDPRAAAKKFTDEINASLAAL
jgi:orotidine-5'-phosphate decarboxylase